jgi:polynucleotide 5'-hydroxyl-kinase GRC3/NOL9
MNTIDDRDVLIVLQELRTGIEGLGCVVRTFEGVFDQASTERTLDLPLECVHLVCHSFSDDASFAYGVEGDQYHSWYACLSSTSILGGCFCCITTILHT